MTAASGLGLPTFGYGAAALGNLYRAMDDQQAAATVAEAWTRGIRLFDVAPHYGLGLAERRLGAALRRYPREDYILSTKVGRILLPRTARPGETDQDNGFVVPADQRRAWDASAAGLRRSLEDSLHRLGTDRVDIAYLHDPEENVPAGATLHGMLEQTLPALSDLRDQGLVRAVGVGSKSVSALLESVRIGGPDVLMLSGRHTLLDRSADPELLPACLAAGVLVVAVSVYNSGLLAETQPHPGLPFDYQSAPDRLVEQARTLAAVCRDHGTDLPTAALQFPLRHPAVGSVVVGAAGPTQVAQNAERFGTELPDQLWVDLGRVVAP